MSESPTVLDGPVVVVGGGVAGLVAAHLLAEAGAEVTVIERGPVLGGLARSYHYEAGGGRFVFDIGPHRFDTSNPNVEAYLARVLGQQGTTFPRKSEVFFKGTYYSWPIKPQNLLQLPPSLAARSFVDLAINGFKQYGGDNFENYILRQYGPTLYKHFFEGYTIKFLDIHPSRIHSDWAKVGINRAIIDDKAQMQNLFQLLRSTLAQANKKPQDFLYPRDGMQVTWERVGEALRARGARVVTGVAAELEGDGRRVEAVRAGELRVERPAMVVWTAPITVATEQLGLGRPRLDYLAMLVFNVMVAEDCPRDYQWCYYGARDLLINRVSIPRFFSTATAPPGTTGYCCEVTCMEGDRRWLHGERLTDWIVDDLVRVGLVRSRANVLDVRVERVPETYPIYRVDYPAELDRARSALAGVENLRLAGRTGLFWYNNMDHSIENALQLVKRLLREAGRTELDEAALARGAHADGDARARGA